MTTRGKILFASVVLLLLSVAIYGLTVVISQLPIAFAAKAILLLTATWLTMGILSMGVLDLNGGLTRPGDADPEPLEYHQSGNRRAFRAVLLDLDRSIRLGSLLPVLGVAYY